jgi:Ni,Fe-hydrogenase I large subunit
MNTYIPDLVNNTTLAPLQEFYNPQNLGNRDSQVLASISKSSIGAIEQALGSLTHLIANLKTYKQCMIDSINLQAESADIATKYAVSVPSQSHTLPGVLTAPQSYDLQGIRSDNERMEQVKSNKEKVMAQKKIYLRLAEEDMRIATQSFKRLMNADLSFEEFCEVLSANINQNY